MGRPGQRARLHEGLYVLTVVVGVALLVIALVGP
jgi:hypothetical protein